MAEEKTNEGTQSDSPKPTSQGPSASGDGPVIVPSNQVITKGLSAEKITVRQTNEGARSQSDNKE